MKSRTILTALAIALVGCATASKVPLANGVQGFAIECEKLARCYTKAAEVCAPAQYEIVAQGQRSEGAMTGGMGAFGQKQSLTIVCKK